jgi:gliding motility-associated-like protein
VEWSKPNATDLDTLQNPPPYRYQLLRADGIAGTNFTAIPTASFVTVSFANANDTSYVDLGLNTIQTGYNYKVAFYVNGETQPLGETQPASSIFLTVAPTDKANNLSWQENVPWINTRYVVFLENNGDLTVLDTVAQNQYQHTGLENGQNYCYLIQSIGSYGVDGIISPILNYSQIACGSPSDNVAPCPPVLMVVNICSDVLINFPLMETDNLLNWTNPSNICPEQDDVVGYNIYYTQIQDEPLVQIGTTLSPRDTFYLDQPGVTIAGCYEVTAIDDNGNESERSNLVCVDNCPVYLLPNTFTPNGDGANDAFVPYPYRFIESIELQVFNRWGQLVFETNDPDINWTGINLNGENLAEGVYFYTCRVFERRVIGIVPQKDLLRGAIHLIRGEE